MEVASPCTNNGENNLNVTLTGHLHVRSPQNVTSDPSDRNDHSIPTGPLGRSTWKMASMNEILPLYALQLLVMAVIRRRNAEKRGRNGNLSFGCERFFRIEWNLEILQLWFGPSWSTPFPARWQNFNELRSFRPRSFWKFRVWRLVCRLVFLVHVTFSETLTLHEYAPSIEIRYCCFHASR